MIAPFETTLCRSQRLGSPRSRKIGGGEQHALLDQSARNSREIALIAMVIFTCICADDGGASPCTLMTFFGIYLKLYDL